jgi:hypothetical protein
MVITVVVWSKTSATPTRSWAGFWPAGAFPTVGNPAAMPSDAQAGAEAPRPTGEGGTTEAPYS